MSNTMTDYEVHRKDCKCYRQADVLDQTRLRAHSDRGVLSHKNQQLETQQLKSIPQPIDSRIANTLITSQNNGLSLNVVKEIGYRLRQLAKHSNLLDPEYRNLSNSCKQIGQKRRRNSGETFNFR